MSPSRLTPEVMLSITLDAICSRNRYTSDPGPVIDELLKAAGERRDLLAESVGTWVGFFEDDYTRTLCAALRDLPDVEGWVALGVYRRSLPHHRTPEASGSAGSWPKRR